MSAELTGEKPQSGTASGAATVKADNLAKAFGATRALRDCSLEVRPGEVLGVMGENGSGKSTLVKILSGVHRPDSGSLAIAGEPVARLRSTRQSMQAGISTVFQEVLVVGPRSVADNVWLGVDDLFRRRMPDAEKRRRAQEILSTLMAHPPHLDTPVEYLSLSERQACCIARALMHEPKMLILDEATSALDVETRDRLFDMLRDLTSKGKSVVFISHRMDEMEVIADRVMVMRSGETVATLDKEQATPSELVRLMTGSDHLVDAEPAERERKDGAEVLLDVKGLVLREDRKPIDLQVRAGEIVGLAGLEGHGQDAFIQALSHMSGDAAAYVPRERRNESLFDSKSIRENFGMPTLAEDMRNGWLRKSETRARLSTYIDRLSIKLADPDNLITTLSGGNQQKVVMARWLATHPKVLLLNDPTRGVDIGAKRDLYGLLVELAEQGIAIVMLSTELDEHVELMDRVIVFREYEVVRELPRKSLSRQSLLAAFFGQESSNA